MSQLSGIIVDEVGAAISSALYSVEITDVDGNAVTATITKNNGQWTITDLDFSVLYKVSISYAGRRRVIYCGTETQLKSLVIGENAAVLGEDGVIHISPTAPGAPLILSADAQGQRVVGFDADTVDGRHANNTANNLLVLGADGMIPTDLYQQYTPGDPTTDALTLEGHPANYFATATHTHPAGAATNADTVDNCHAGTGANNVLKLDGSGKVPGANLPVQIGNIRILYGNNVNVPVNSTVHVTFAATFSAVPAVTTGDHVWSEPRAMITNITTTGFDIARGGGAADNPALVDWIAIGPA